MSSVAQLGIRLLGELDVRRGDRVVALPPSRKTRALLAYLVLTGRAHRRDQLCELFWDVTDDPRGALRWSLSKLRGLVDDEGAPRIEADRDEVGFRACDARVDVLEVRRALAGRSLEAVPVDELERLAASHRGELLEGLDLPDFDAYQAWCVAEREEARGARATLLDELVHRLRDDPARAVEHARARVQLDPHDAGARAALIRVLGALGHRDEARTHVASGRRLVAELGGRGAADEIEAAWREIDRGDAVARPRARASAPPPPSGGEVPLIGRAAELELLDRLVEGSARTGFQAMLLTGDPGAGKSRLLAEWTARAQARGVVVVAGASFEGGAGLPYRPWIDALQRLPAAADRPRSDFARVVRTPDDDGEAPIDRQRLYDGVGAELAAAAPVVIALDDAHWLDAGSAALLAHVARVHGGVPIAVIVAARAGEIVDNPALGRALRALRQLGVLAEQPLPPLDEPQTAALVRAVASDADVARVFAQSAGNPLFALELARAAASGAGDLPGSVAAAIRDRLAALPDDAAQVLRCAAVLGRGVTLEELEALSGLAGEVAVATLELLARRALLVPDPDAAAPGAHRFAHELVRRVVYDGLSEPRRRLMHRRVAQWLAGRAGRDDVDVAVVAQHAALAHDSALAAETCLAAARRSLRVFAAADAHALARRGLRHAEGLGEPDRTRRSLELFEVALAARRPDEVEPIARQVEALADHALDLGCPEHARLGYHLLAYLRWEHGSWSDTRRHMRRAQLVSRSAGEPEQIIGMAEAARCLVLLEEDLGEAQALALEAAARGRLANVEPPATFAALGMLRLHQGALDEARRDLERARSVAEVRRDRHDEFQALEQLAVVEIEAGDFAAARRRAEELAALGARFPGGSEAPFARGLVALARRGLGDDTDAELDAARDALIAVDAKQRLAYLMSRAAWLDAERGDLGRAGERAAVALAAAEVLHRATEITLARAVLARAAQGGGDAAGAAAQLDEAATRWDRVAAPCRARLMTLLADRVPARPAPQEEP